MRKKVGIWKAVIVHLFYFEEERKLVLQVDVSKKAVVIVQLFYEEEWRKVCLLVSKSYNYSLGQVASLTDDLGALRENKLFKKKKKKIWSL